MSCTRTVAGWRRRIGAPVLVLALTVSLAACDDDAGQPLAPTTLKVTAEGIVNGAEIPARYTCVSGGAAPELKWSGDSRDGQAFAVVVDDADASGGTFVHWVVLDLPADTRQLRSGDLPPQAVEAENSAGGQGWTPPCPPSGTHHYRFTVYALRSATNLIGGAPTDAALKEIEERAVARGQLIGTVTHQ